ncbi:MAG: YdeI/OmpD-associated family protein [Candidatus Limnocylindria bacterium]
MASDLPTVSFETEAALRAWLERHHDTSAGIWVRVARRSAGVPSVTFEQLLEQGLCFGWSESSRRRGDGPFYLQRFTPRRSKGTTSARNVRLAERLSAEGKMTAAGREALGLAGRG